MAMARMLFVAVAMTLALAHAADWEVDEGVIVGTDDNFNKVLDTHEFVLAEFYAPWCGHCKQLAPQYAKAAQQLQASGSPVALVKVDATIHDKAAEKYEVQGYPTLKWIVKGEAEEYSGGRTASEIVAWVNKKSGPAAAPIADVAAAQAASQGAEVFVLGIFASESSAEATTFIEAAKASSSLSFGISTNAAVATHYGVSVPGVVVIKSFDDGNAKFEGEMTVDAIARFANAESLPLVVEFNDENAPKIFGGEIKSHLLLFADAKDETFPSLKAALSKASRTFKGKLLFITIDGTQGDNGRILDYFNIDGSRDLPTLRIINLETDMAKYKYESETIDEASILAFVQSYVDGTLKRHLMAEEVPADWDAKPVKVVTGKNFQEVVMAEDKDAFVFFHAPWCGHCKQMAPTWEKLGEKFVGHDGVVIAKIDATANEIESISVESFPTLKFFPKNGRPAEDYEGSRSLEGLVAFVSEKTGISVEVTDADKASVADDTESNVEYEEDAADEGVPAGTGHEEL